MSRAVKIAVAGTHSTGKTTFIATLERGLTELGYAVAKVTDLGRQAAERGFPILHNHTPRSTLWIMTRGISLELEAEHRSDVVLVDRPVPDALGYYRAALTCRDEQPPPVWRDYLSRLARDHAATYDLIFKTELDATIPLGDDKPRDTDLRFRMLVDHAITAVLIDLAIPYHGLPPAGHPLAVRLALDHVRDRTRSHYDSLLGPGEIASSRQRGTAEH
ncbi:MAG: AAA family ATPase [Egibacteraceae bacterium]